MQKINYIVFGKETLRTSLTLFGLTSLFSLFFPLSEFLVSWQMFIAFFIGAGASEFFDYMRGNKSK